MRVIREGIWRAQSILASWPAGLGGACVDTASRMVCAAPALLIFVYLPSKSAAIAVLLAYAVFRSVGDLNIVPLLCHIAGEKRRSTAVGLTNILNTGTAGVGVLLAGMLKRDFGHGGVFVGVGAILLLDAVLLFAGYLFFLPRNSSTKEVKA